MMVTVPKLLRFFYPSLEWSVKNNSNSVYLTFDDGPHPQITEQVLDILDQYNAQATFFCVGDNVRKYPKIYQQIITRGHKTGIHTFHHLNGWRSANTKYLQDVEEAAKLIDSNLFRPPYGKISPYQIFRLKKKYRIIMWTVLTYDFSKAISPQVCLQNSLLGLKAGYIVVFHDSEKSKKNMQFALPRFLEQSQKMGFNLKSL